MTQAGMHDFWQAHVWYILRVWKDGQTTPDKERKIIFIQRGYISLKTHCENLSFIWTPMIWIRHTKKEASEGEVIVAKNAEKR